MNNEENGSVTRAFIMWKMNNHSFVNIVSQNE